jgi:hypothetical protein
MRRAVAALALGLTVLLVGGGGIAAAEASATGKPLSAKQFRRAANAICATGNRQIADIAARIFSGGEQEQPDAAALRAYVGDVEPVVKKEIRSIGALKPPTKLAKRVTALLRTARGDLGHLVRDPTIVLESDPFADTKVAAKRLGLTSCAS